MGKTKNVQSTVQTRDPYAAAQPGLQSAGAGVTDWMTSPEARTAYGGPRVAQMSDMTKQGIDAMGASTGAKASESYLKDVLGGNYLGASNPYTAQLLDSIRAGVMPSVNSRVSASGMAPGSSVDQALVTKELGRATAAPLFAREEAERGRMTDAAHTLPGVSQGIIGNQIGAGQLSESYDQRNIDATRQAFEENRIAGLRPFAEATPILSQIGSQGGSSSNTTTQQTKVPLAQQIAGGAMMAGSMFTPMGMFGGGLPGLGMFGGGGQAVNGYANNDPGGTYYSR